jgi:hypothetical protein
MALPVLTTIKVRGDTAANWTAVNPVLQSRELGVETNTRKLKLGDGVTAWTSLPYIAVDQAVAVAALAAVTPAADRLFYFTGPSAGALATFTGFARNLVDDPDAATARATLGVVIGTDVQGQNANLAAIAGLTTVADRLTYWTGAGAAALATFTAAGRALVDDADASAQRTTLGLGTSAVKNTGTSGDAVPVLNGAATTWANGITITAGSLILSDGGMTVNRSTTGGVTFNCLGAVSTYNSTNSNTFKLSFQNAGAAVGAIGAHATAIFVIANSAFAIRHSFTDTGWTFTSGGTNVMVGSAGGVAITGQLTATTWLKSGSYTVATVPSAATAGAGAQIYVSNESGGAVTAFSDGTNWRRVTDRAIIS